MRIANFNLAIPHPQSSMPPPQKNRRWIWYFAILVVLTVAATGTLIVYNLAQQLKPEQLAAARQLWKEKGPKNYALVFTKKIDEGDSPDKVSVKVKDGKVVEGFLNGLPIPDKMHYYSMDKLFEDIDRFMSLDQEKGKPRVYVRAEFDPNTGAVLWYVRRVMGTQTRLEIKVEKLEATKG